MISEWILCHFPRVESILSQPLECRPSISVLRFLSEKRPSPSFFLQVKGRKVFAPCFASSLHTKCEYSTKDGFPWTFIINWKFSPTDFPPVFSLFLMIYKNKKKIQGYPRAYPPLPILNLGLLGKMTSIFSKYISKEKALQSLSSNWKQCNP